MHLSVQMAMTGAPTVDALGNPAGPTGAAGAAAVPATGPGVRPRRARSRTFFPVLAAAALLLGAGALTFSKAPEIIGNEVVRDIRVLTMEPILERLVADLPGTGAGLFRDPPESMLIARIRDRAKILQHQGLALFDAQGRMIWQSDPGASRVSPGMLESVLGGSGLQILHEETAAPAGTDGSKTRSDMTTIVAPVAEGGEVRGAIAIRFEESLLEAKVARMTRLLLTLFAAAAAITAGVVLFGALRLQRIRAGAEQEVLMARNAAMAEQLRLGREMALLAELNEWLQSCHDLDELFAMVVRFLDVLLPGSRGSIYIYSNSRDVLDGAASWGGMAHHAHIHPQDSWALRRGRTYEYGESAVSFACPYVAEAAPGPYLSIPFLAHGETVGLLHIVYPDNLGMHERTRFRRMAQTCAEQISIAIANVRMRDELRSQAVRDPLTGLYNRRYMMDRLRSLSERRQGQGFALISIDIDRFKTFNDNHGHEAGDAVLRAVAEAMIAVLPAKAFACRSGGEELAIVMAESDLPAGLDLAEQLRARVETTQVSHNGTALPAVTISVGVAAFPRHGSRLAEIVQRADMALYTAKHNGRNRVVSADDADPGILSGTALPGASPVALPADASDTAMAAE
ncbi:MAG: diguanylate cyclase [Albidovulum sp.]